jgi:tetratricopeptide (TPR) repeat protein
MAKRSASQELLEFEINFYQRLLDAHPDFPDALAALGNAYTRSGRHDQGLATDLKLTQLRPSDPIAWYNLACSYALTKRTDEALQMLRRAVELGYDDFSYLLRDPDFAAVRQSPALKQLLKAHASPNAPSASA